MQWSRHCLQYSSQNHRDMWCLDGAPQAVVTQATCTGSCALLQSTPSPLLLSRNSSRRSATRSTRPSSSRQSGDTRTFAEAVAVCIIAWLPMSFVKLAFPSTFTHACTHTRTHTHTHAHTRTHTHTHAHTHTLSLSVCWRWPCVVVGCCCSRMDAQIPCT